MNGAVEDGPEVLKEYSQAMNKITLTDSLITNLSLGLFTPNSKML